MIKLLLGIAFLGSIIWLIADPDYEPAIASITSLTALVTAFVTDKEKQASQQQNVAENGVGIQAGGDVTVGDINKGKESSNAE